MCLIDFILCMLLIHQFYTLLFENKTLFNLGALVYIEIVQ